MRFDELLRDTIDEPGSDLHVPPGLAAAAIAQGRRIRTRRRVAVTAGVVAAVVAILLPAAVLSGAGDRAQLPAVPVPSDSGGPPMTGDPLDNSPAPSAAQGRLYGGWRVMAAGDVALSAAGTYSQVQPAARRTVLIAPAGHRALVQVRPDDPMIIADVSGGHQVTFAPQPFNGSYHWSPTGDRLVSGYLMKDNGESGFGIIDARTGAVTKHPVDRTLYDCSRCSYAFTRDGREVLMPLADRSGGEAVERVRGLQFFNADTGAPTRTVLVNTWIPDSPFAFSPDGRFMITTADVSEAQVGRALKVDLVQQKVENFPWPAVWVTDTQLIGVDGMELVNMNPNGTWNDRFAVGVPDAGWPIVLGPPA
ncbi:hypothetical protein [Dactylosporangium sp. NPDC051541]|uniref:hypothetical protein n=1 Tax=Dactylosporangium sp. NPDC051541 TaxID=3363977 RepID=UPI0037B09099